MRGLGGGGLRSFRGAGRGGIGPRRWAAPPWVVPVGTCRACARRSRLGTGIRSDMEPPEELLRHDTWLVERSGAGGRWRSERPARTATPSSRTSRESRTATAASALAGIRLGLPRDALPALDDGRYYWVDLIGLEVLDEAGESARGGAGDDRNRRERLSWCSGRPSRRRRVVVRRGIGSSRSLPATWFGRWTSTRVASGSHEPFEDCAEVRDGRPVNIAVVTLFPAMLDALRGRRGDGTRGGTRTLPGSRRNNPRDFAAGRPPHRR